MAILLKLTASIPAISATGAGPAADVVVDGQTCVRLAIAGAPSAPAHSENGRSNE